MTTTFNINREVKVKLTPVGMHQLEHEWAEAFKNHPVQYPFHIRQDENGYSTHQLWRLIATFGHLDWLDHAMLPFETDIILLPETNLAADVCVNTIIAAQVAETEEARFSRKIVALEDQLKYMDPHCEREMTLEDFFEFHRDRVSSADATGRKERVCVTYLT